MTTRFFGWFLSLLALGWFSEGCVSVDDANLPSTKDYHSFIRFVNIAVDSSAALTIELDSVALGAVAHGQSSNYFEILSGSHSIAFGGATELINFPSDEQSTIFIHHVTGTGRMTRVREGYSTVNNGKPGVARVSFVNVAKGFASTISFRDASRTGTVLTNDVSYLISTPYVAISPGNHTVYAVSKGGYSATIDGSQLSPAVDTRSSGSGVFTLSVEKGLEYTPHHQSMDRDAHESTHSRNQPRKRN